MGNPNAVDESGHVTFVFETSHHAFQAEDVARDSDVAVEVVPAPSRAASRCGIALRVAEGRASGLAEAFEREGIRFDRFDDA